MSAKDFRTPITYVFFRKKAELEPDEDDATGQNSEDGAEEQGGGEESQPDAVEQRG